MEAFARNGRVSRWLTALGVVVFIAVVAVMAFVVDVMYEAVHTIIFR